jgi:integrase/recombinase XerD
MPTRKYKRAIPNRVELACATIRGFQRLITLYQQHMSVLGRSESTIRNYSSQLAAISLHFKKSPLRLTPQEVEKYLYDFQKRTGSKSPTMFKFTIYSLRSLLKSRRLPYSKMKLPILKFHRPLPTVLSKQEVAAIIEQATNLKHRVAASLLYGCGLRCMELRNLRVCDLNLDRQQLHVVCGKGGKDRVLPLPKRIIPDLKRYIRRYSITDWLFGRPRDGRAGGDFDGRYSQRGVQWMVKQLATKAKINRRVGVHTLRHCFATHLLDDGMDLITLQRLMGHSTLNTTILYLNFGYQTLRQPFSPLDTLFKRPKR